MAKLFIFIVLVVAGYFAFIHYRTVPIVAKGEKEVRTFIASVEKKYNHYMYLERKAVRYITPRTRL